MSCRKVIAVIRRLVAPALVAGAALAASGDVGAHENHAPLPTKGVTIAGDTIMLSDKAREAIGLTTAKVEFGDIHRTVTVNAKVELPWNAQAMITSLVPGRIDQVLVRPGEAVAQGQELARVVSNELASLQLTLLQAKAELALARKLCDQRTALDQQGVIAGKTLLEAQATLAQKSAALEIARQKLVSLGLDQAMIQKVEQDGQPRPHVSVTSPIGGSITHADVRIGQLISATDHLYHVVDPARRWIVGDVLESDVRFLKSGQSVEASFTALPKKTFGGRVDHLRLKMNRQTRTQGVVIAVENPGGDLRPGMSGRVQVSVQVAKEAIVCPADAVKVGRPRDEVMAQIRDIVAEVPGLKVNIGQPISHRLDHMMSGIRSQIAVKLYGRDIEELRDRGQDIAEVMTAVPGVVDLQIEPQVDIPQVRVTIRRREAARYGLAPADVAKALETALQGRTVSQVLEGQKVFDLVVWFDEQARNNIDAIRSTLISTPDGSRVALGTVADVEATQGPNTINRENVQRRIVIQCNTAGRDLVAVVRDIQQAATKNIEPTLKDGYFIEYGGQFQARQDANRRLLLPPNR